MRLICPLCHKKIEKNEAVKTGYRFYCRKCMETCEAMKKSFDDLHKYFDKLATES